MRIFVILGILALAAPARAQYPLVTNTSQLCVSEEGGWVYTRACTPSQNKYQFVYHAGRNAFVFRTNSGGCLSPDDGSGNVHSGSPLRSVVCNGRLEQDWFHTPSGQIQNKRHTNLCMDVEGGLAAGRRVLVYQCDLNPVQAYRAANQRFFMGGQVRPLMSGQSALPVQANLGASTVVRTFAGGARVIAAGGGNVIAAGGGNVIAAGGGNVIAAGGGN